MMNSRSGAALARHARVIGSAIIAVVAWGHAASAQRDARSSRALPAKSSAKPLIDVPRIAYTRVVLKNGLVVLLHEDHSSPIVALDLTYHVGSKDEVVGKRGFAHFFEHAMYNGSAHVEPGEYVRIVESGGGAMNAETRE